MVSRERKIAIFKSYPDLIDQMLANDRVSIDYTASKARGYIIAHELSHTGNGYVNAKYMRNTIGYRVDPQGWICIKYFSEEQLHAVIQKAMVSMSK